MSRVLSAGLDRIYDSRGRATVEATITLESGAEGRAGAPSGASTGGHEVAAFPAGGVPEALERFSTELLPRLPGVDSADQAGFDRLLVEIDGTARLTRLGGNTTTALSVALLRAHARETGEPMWKLLARSESEGRKFPAVVGNCINGGRHAIGGPDIQEFIAYSEGPSFDASVRAALLVHARIGEELHRRFPRAALGRGDEGGWVAAIGNTEALELLSSACASVRDETKIPVHPGVDFAANEFHSDGRYRYREQTLDAAGQLGFVASLADRYGLRYIEDPFEEEAFEAFSELTRRLGRQALVVGDDLYVTDEARVRRGVEARSTNALLVKVNQVGTVSRARAAADLALSSGWATVASHRSGETPDDWLAHIALGIGARAIKTGLLGGERVAKLNELLRLERRAH